MIQLLRRKNWLEWLTRSSKYIVRNMRAVPPRIVQSRFPRGNSPAGSSMATWFPDHPVHAVRVHAGENGYRLRVFASFVGLTLTAGSITRNQVYVSWYAYFQTVTYDLDVMQASSRPRDHCHAQPLFPTPRAPPSHVETCAILRLGVTFLDTNLHRTSSSISFSHNFPFPVLSHSHWIIRRTIQSDVQGYSIFSFSSSPLISLRSFFLFFFFFNLFLYNLFSSSFVFLV